jgi:glycosyltransferase involved in cell wall biosynthesis
MPASPGSNESGGRARDDDPPGGTTPALSLVIPCYNEEEVLPQTVSKLARAFDRADIALQLVCVDNGSRDRTRAIIADLEQRFTGVVTPVHIEQNIGMGNGVLTGIPFATAPVVGIIPADGQVDAEDVVRLYEAMVEAGGNVLAKVRRRFRMDGLTRKVVSVGYNVFARILWPGLGSWDLNGCPVMMPRDTLTAMELQSRNWLFNPEMLIKAHYMGLRVMEFNVFARARGRGVSHVGAGTVWEFIRYLLRLRFSPSLRNWRNRKSAGAGDARPHEASA